MGRFIDLSGQQFGRLTVIGRAVGKRSTTGSVVWECICTCGQRRYVVQSSLRTGRTQSCGCYSADMNAARRAPDGISGMNTLFHHYKQSAKKRSIPFTLQRDEFTALTSAACHYCGSSPANKIGFNKKDYAVYTYNGIDRVDNDRGYDMLNCVTCCATCNSYKSNRSYAEFISHVARINAHMNRKR